MHLKDMKIGEKGRIVRVVAGAGAYRQRILAMGLIPGTVFAVARIAPLGDPVEIAVRGYSLSLRRDEAHILEIERV